MQSASLVAVIAVLGIVATVLMRRLRDARRKLCDSEQVATDLQLQISRAFGDDHIHPFRWNLDDDVIQPDGRAAADAPSVPGARVIEALHAEDRLTITGVIDRLRRDRNGSYLEEIRLRSTGSSAWHTFLVAGQVSQCDSDSQVIVRGTAIDLTATRLLESEARENESRFLALAESMPQIVYTADGVGRIEYVNRRWTEYTGLTSADSEVLVEVVHPADHRTLEEAWRMALATGTELSAEFRLRRASDQSYRWFLARAVPFRDESGAVARWHGTSTDIEYVRSARERLEVADQRKDEFLATLSHELRNPLAPIRNAVAIVQLSKTGAEVPWAIELIDRQSTYLTRLVDDLMDVSRISAGLIELQLTDVDLTEVVQDAIDASPALHGATVRAVDVRAVAPVRVRGDKARLVQIVLNLLNNACKYSDDGTPIRISVERDGAAALIQVADEGIGIASDQLDSIFEMFVQVKDSLYRSSGGLGIGLSLVKKLAELHGGSVSVKSAGAGSGSTFAVRLPAIAQDGETLTQPDAQVRHATVADTTDALRIFLVDDGEDAVSSMAAVLETRGATVLTAGRGADVVPRATTFRPHVIVLDISLPDMTGYDVCRLVRAQEWGSSVAIIALTGWGTSSDRALADAAGFDRFVLKPAHPDVLLKLAAELRRR